MGTAPGKAPDRGAGGAAARGGKRLTPRGAGPLRGFHPRPAPATSVSRRSAVFRDLYDRTSAQAQGALYAWMAARLRTPRDATGEPGLRGGVAWSGASVLENEALRL